ncbi:hypothetical protein PYW08_011085 [Mythimna loreyi]|uniref:Uncharacterized protein n=1 Tax=Mythimna loreyi TaxID=667449 RepID=A0ACC2Q3K9_9NEOP|nr:hypothetical protein PYW08_011085 [Mythimna loreyi]
MQIGTKALIVVLATIYVAAIVTCVNYVWALNAKNATVDEKFWSDKRNIQRHVVALSAINQKLAYSLADRFPFVIAVTRNATSLWTFACFGSLILRNWMVTTAHCR